MAYDELTRREQTELDEQVVSDHLARPAKTTAGKRLGYLIFALCFLLGLILLPSLSERIAHSLTRGVESAKREEALKLLEGLPEASSRIPWIVKAVGPSVVGIQADNVSQGTGIVIDPAGYILTNFHVIRNRTAIAARLNVRFNDGRSQSDGVYLIGYDELNDLAVIKVDMADLTPIRWGDSDALEVGEPVVAVGNPYGLDHSVTMGILSAKQRYKMTPDGVIVQEFLQTDAAINPGNSGGPLVDTRGELIGINTEILGESYQGISFAIPSNLARKVYDRILAEAAAKTKNPKET